MKFDISKPTNSKERDLSVLISRYQKSQSGFSRERAISFAKKNWSALREDFKKACYWVFGRGAFVKTALNQPVSENLERVERLILARQEESGLYDV